MSALPISLNAERVRALVVGGGAVGTRKVLALLEAGAHVRVVSPELTDEIAHAGAENRLEIELQPYTAESIGDATLVIAATGSRDVNSRIAADARALGKLVNVVDAPEDSDFHSMAVHRSGDLTVAVSTGGVPGAARRIRDALSVRFDTRYDRALAALRRLRAQLRAEGGDSWDRAAKELIAEDFCASVEKGSLPERVAAWR